MKAKQDDPEATPKARNNVPRTVSAGEFLKSEYHSIFLDDDSYYTKKPEKDHDNCAFQSSSQQQQSLDNQDPPKIPERRLSKSKTFFLKVLPHRPKESTQAQRAESNDSRNTLIRRLSRAGSRNSFPIHAPENFPLPGAFPDRTSGDYVDATYNLRVSSYVGSEAPSSLSTGTSSSSIAPKDALILCPQVRVTPELSAVDGGVYSVWVAIEVTGILRRADGTEEYRGGLRRFSSVSSMQSPGMSNSTQIFRRG